MARPNTRHRREFLKATTAVGIAGLAGCVGGDGGGDGDDGDGGTVTGTPTPTATPEPVSIEVGTASSGSTGVLMEVALGEELDIENGIDIEPQRAAAPQVEQILVNRGVEVAYMSANGTAKSRAEGREISIFGPWLADHNSLMVLPDSEVESWEDLLGESVGTLPEQTGTFNHTSLRLAAEGMSFTEDFDLRKGSPGSIHSLNARGDIAAHMHFIPVTVKNLEEGNFREVEYLPDKLNELFGRNLHFVSLAAYDSFIDENSEVARGIRQTILDAAELLNNEPSKYLSRYRDVSGYETDAQVEFAAERTPSIYPTEWDDEARSNIKDQVQRGKDLGILPEDVPTDVVADL
jgi:ABC-type nitrate/sulfonate/bicarbonate transport system substrate-binding protein